MICGPWPAGKSTELTLPAERGFHLALGGRKCLRIGLISLNGLNILEKRRKLVESFEKGRVDVMGVQETHIKDYGVMECMKRE